MPFTGVAGELSYSDGVLVGDVDGDALPDFAILFFDPATNLTAADFLL